MNDKLKNYATAPDPEVWEKIEKTMRRRVLRRYVWTAAAGVAVVILALVGIVLWPDSTARATQSAMPDVAQVLPREQVCKAPASQEPVATEMVINQTRMANSKSVKVEQTVTTVASPQVSKTQAEERTVVVQPVVSSQPVPSAVATSPAQVVVPTVSETVVRESQSDNEPVKTMSEPATQQAKSATNYGVEDTILWLPNAFVPGSDDDEINTFRVRLNHPGDVLTNFRMTIFSRSGNQVFTSNDINNGWDGTNRGRELPQAAYVYVIYYTDKDGFRHQRKGTVTLVR